jgi:hypothetical protein
MSTKFGLLVNLGSVGETEPSKVFSMLLASSSEKDNKQRHLVGDNRVHRRIVIPPREEYTIVGFETDTYLGQNGDFLNYDILHELKHMDIHMVTQVVKKHSQSKHKALI